MNKIYKIKIKYNKNFVNLKGGSFLKQIIQIFILL